MTSSSSHSLRESADSNTISVGGRVFVVTLGGTIAMTADAVGGALRPTLSAEQLLSAVPGLSDHGVELEVEDFRRLPGASLGFDDLAQLSARLETAFTEGARGAVVVQGTDTIEETAYLLELAHRGRPEPIVVTGAMRNPAAAGADGPGNLLAAVQVAASPAARGLGTLVVLADQIHAAFRVRKTHSTELTAFSSPDGGPIGQLVEGRPVIMHRPYAGGALPKAQAGTHPQVLVLPVVFGDTGIALDALPVKVDGVVLAAFGAGHVPSVLVDRLERLAARIPVVLASRTGAGPVLQSTYGFPGSESDLLARGLIHAGYLDPLKARLLLRHLLAAGAPGDTIRDTFASESGLTPAAARA